MISPDELSPRADLAIAFLNELAPGRDREITAILKNDNGKDDIKFRRFAPDDDVGLANFISALNSQGYGIYYSPNPTTATVKRATKNDVIFAAYLYIDIDPRAGEDLVKEQERMRLALSRFIPRPTFVVMSGGGYQALWRLAAPVDLDGENGPETARIEGFNKAIEIALGGDNCHSIEHLYRLPGTINWPHAKKRKRGQVPTLAWVAHSDAALAYGLEEFPAPPLLQGTPSAALEPRAISDLSQLEAYGLPDWVHVNILHGDDTSRLNDMHINAGRKNFKPYSTRSEPMLGALIAMTHAGVPEDLMLGILLDPRFGISAQVREKKKARAYAERQVKQARKFALVQPGAVQWVQVTKEGLPKVTTMNAVQALKAIGLFAGKNDFSDRLMIGGGGLGDAEREVSDEAVVVLRRIVFEQFGIDFGKDNIQQAIETLCYLNPFDPLLEHLDDLVWDGTSRIHNWVVTYLGASDTELNRELGRLTLLAMVARAKDPGVKYDNMLVLEGEQGTFKSTAVKILAGGDDFFTDAHILGARDKEQAELLQGKWIIEIGELAGMQKQDVETLKAFLSRTVDRSRAVWTRYAADKKRRCIFIGTTNGSVYLIDQTGNRRIWPLRTGKIDIEKLRNDRDQLVAEAVSAYQPKMRLDVDQKLADQLKDAQEERTAEDPWLDSLREARGERYGDVERIASADVIKLVQPHVDTRSQANMRRICQLMPKLGWTKKRIRLSNGQNVQGFERPYQSPPLDEETPF